MASLIGTTIEWYDFFLYGTAASLVAAAGGSFWPVVAWMVLLCIITLVSVYVAAETYQGGEFATEQSSGRLAAAEQA